jgi:hypothetical protein
VRNVTVATLEVDSQFEFPACVKEMTHVPLVVADTIPEDVTAQLAAVPPEMAYATLMREVDVDATEIELVHATEFGVGEEIDCEACVKFTDTMTSEAASQLLLPVW